MGLRYQKRIGGNKGWGINISGSGVSSSYRSKYGTISSKGFSIRSGIPGLTFRSGWSSSKNKGNAALFLIIIMSVIYFLYILIVISYNFLRFIWWLLNEITLLLFRIFNSWKESRKQL